MLLESPHKKLIQQRLLEVSFVYIRNPYSIIEILCPSSVRMKLNLIASRKRLNEYIIRPVVSASVLTCFIRYLQIVYCVTIIIAKFLLTM